MPAIQVKQLSKYYKVHQKEAGVGGALRSLISRTYYDVKAVETISFSIEQGELIGFIGPNGAGKTTTLKVLSGLLYPTTGEVSVLGFEPYKRQEQFQKQFSLVMGQKNQLWWDLPAQESFLLNKEIYEIPEEKYRSTLRELVSMLGIEDLLKIQVRKLSLGQRMKAELVAALLHTPKVLFLDEPTIGLDVVAQKNLREFIKQYNKRYHATIILTSHYMADVQELCERVIIIDHGKIIFDGKLADIVARFATTKLLTLKLVEPKGQEIVAHFENATSLDPLQVQIEIPRQAIAETASVLLRKYPIADLTIAEPSIEDIIRQLFSTGQLSA